MPRRRTSRTPLAELDPVLGPPFRSTTSDQGRPVALAVLARGISAGIDPPTIRRWLSARDPVRSAAITSSSRRWHSVLSAALRHIESVNDLAARGEKTAVLASRLVGLLLTPVPERRGLTAHQESAARQCLAVVGLEVLTSMRERGWDTALVHAPRLAVTLGVSPKTARSLLRTCERAGWLRCVSKKSGGGARYKLTGRLTAEAREVAWATYDSHAAVAAGSGGVDELADLILHAGHPAWGHSPDRGAKLWLTALADAAEVDVVTLGVAPRAAKRYLRTWLGVLQEVPLDTPLGEILDADALSTGAMVRHAEAEAARLEAAKERKAEVDAQRAAGEWTRVALAQLLKAYPIPLPATSAETRGAWLTSMHQAVAGIDGLDDRHRRTLSKALASKMQAHPARYPKEIAELVAQRIVPTVS